MDGNPITFKQKIRKALIEPGKIPSYIYRRIRNRRLSKGNNFLKFYAGVVNDNAVRNAASVAIGSSDEAHWNEVGSMQFEYLMRHGLNTKSRLLDVGCGNLRFGSRAIDFLSAGNYTGVDISVGMIGAAQDCIAERNLGIKRPYIYLALDANYSFLASNSFDIATAHSVFSHLPIEIVEQVLQSMNRLLKPGGFFDFTYKKSTTGEVYNYLDEDFYYPEEMMLALCEKSGFKATLMDDWKYSQEKIRAVKPLDQ